MGRGVSAITLMLPDGRGVTLAKLRQVIRNNGFVSKRGAGRRARDDESASQRQLRYTHLLCAASCVLVF